MSARACAQLAPSAARGSSVIDDAVKSQSAEMGAM
jgi:hypothetical protein